MEHEELRRKLPKGITHCKDGRYQARYTFQGHRYSIYGHDVEALAQRLQEEKEKRRREAERSARAMREDRHGRCMVPLRPDEQAARGQWYLSSQYLAEDSYTQGSRGFTQTGEHTEPWERAGCTTLTVAEWYRDWMEGYKLPVVKQGTFEIYDCMYQYYIEPVLGAFPLAQVTSKDIQQLYADLMRKGYAKATVNLVRVILNAMYKQAIKSELVMRNPVENAVFPRMQKQNGHRALTLQEQDRFMRAIQGNPLETLFLLALETGMRIGELTGLVWQDINFQRQQLLVRATLKCERGTNRYYRDLPKTEHSSRSIPLLPQMAEQLQAAYQERKRQQQELAFVPRRGLEQLVFLREDGSPVSAPYVRRQLGYITRDAGIERFTPHTLRHTFATRALERGIPPKVVQEILGHSSITMTLDLYTHVLPQTKAEELLKLENLFPQ